MSCIPKPKDSEEVKISEIRRLFSQAVPANSSGEAKAFRIFATLLQD